MIGALAVLFGHAFVLTNGRKGPDPLTALLRAYTPGHSLPAIGVAMFFAISGYLVTQSFARRGSLAAYAEARMLRIYPALIMAVALTLALGFVVSECAWRYWQSEGTVAYAVGNATLLDVRFDLPCVFESNPNTLVNGSLWTLPIEMRMYVWVALAGLLGMLARRALFNVAALAMVVVGLVWPVRSGLVAAEGHLGFAACFLTGAVVFVNRDRLSPTDRGAAAAGVLLVLASFTAAYRLVFAACLAYLVLWVGLHPRLRLPRLDAYGDLSYGTYLYAFPVTQLWVLLLAPVGPWVVLALTLATVLPLAWLSWHVVEERALRLKGSVARLSVGLRRRFAR